MDIPPPTIQTSTSSLSLSTVAGSNAPSALLALTENARVPDTLSGAAVVLAPPATPLLLAAAVAVIPLLAPAIVDAARTCPPRAAARAWRIDVAVFIFVTVRHRTVQYSTQARLFASSVAHAQ